MPAACCCYSDQCPASRHSVTSFVTYNVFIDRQKVSSTVGRNDSWPGSPQSLDRLVSNGQTVGTVLPVAILMAYPEPGMSISYSSFIVTMSDSLSFKDILVQHTDRRTDTADHYYSCGRLKFDCWNPPAAALPSSRVWPLFCIIVNNSHKCRRRRSSDLLLHATRL